MMTSSKRTYATHCVTQVCCTQSPFPCSRPQLTHASARDTQTLKGMSGSVSVGSLDLDVHKVLFDPNEHLCLVWGLILNMILPFLPSCWNSSFALIMGHAFLVGSSILLSMVAQQ